MIKGEAETITITDQEKIKEIQEWKNAKAQGMPLQKIRSQKTLPLKGDNSGNNGSDDDKKEPSTPTGRAPPKPSRAPPTRASMSGKPPPKPTKPPSKPPPRRGTLNAHRRQQR